MAHIVIRKDDDGFVALLTEADAEFWGETLDDLAYTVTNQFKVTLKTLRGLGYPNLGFAAERTWATVVETAVEEARKRFNV